MSGLLRSLQTKLEQVTGFPEALDCLSMVVGKLGFPTVDYGYVRAPIAPNGRLRPIRYYMRNPPPSFEVTWRWVGTSDPMYVAGLSRSVPIDVLDLRETACADSRTQDAWTYLDQVGLTQSIMVPMHLPGGGYSTVAAYWRTRLTEEEWHSVYARYYEPIFIIAHHFHDTLSRRSLLPEESVSQVRLTARECQCLDLIAQGKTTDEVADLLERSSVTVRFHLGNAFKKLGATNRVGAIAEALKLGYISLH